jgi:hypothetical protein
MLIRFWLVAACLAVGLAACGGGATGGSTPSPSTTPFTATDAGFSAVFPATPKRSTQNIDQPGIKTTMTLYLATTNDEQIGVAEEQLPNAPQGPAIQAGLDGGIEGSAKSSNGTILSRSNTTFLGQPAEDAVIQTQGAAVHERLVFIGSKLFVLEGITRTATDKHPDYDRLLATFKTT